jgi:sporulation protein YlmC with PRC-barrel domain
MRTQLRKSVVVLVPALALCLGAGARAANDGAGDADRSSARSAATMTQQHAGDMRLSKLVGANVYDAKGTSLGEIKDAIVDANNSKVVYAIVSYGGFLGLGEKELAQPLHSFRREAARDRLVLDVDRQRLKDAPGFDKGQWPDWKRSDYGSRVDRFWASRDQSADATNAPSGSRDAAASNRSAGALGGDPTATTGNERYVRATKILDADVELANGDDIGDIEDVVVNLNDGSVRYVVLQFDRKWSMDDKLVALPPTAFRPKGDGDDIVLKDASREQLKQAPSFDKNSWPRSDDRSFLSRLEQWRPGDDRASGGAPAPAAKGTSRSSDAGAR